MSVARMHELLTQGKLDGRFAAVGGYWMDYALPCPFVPHEAPISGFCDSDQFADTRDEVGTYNGSSATAPIVMPETVGGTELQAALSTGPAAVVFVVHADDGRYWQCPPAQRDDCANSLVIDRVAWLNGADVNVETSPPANLTASGEQLVFAYKLSASSMNDVDPRFNGQADGHVWYARTAYGQPDADGTSAGVAREVSVETSAVIDERTLAVSDKYLPGRLTLDVDPAGVPHNETPSFTVAAESTTVVDGDLGSRTPPITLYAADYTLTATSAQTTCSQQVTIAASSDVAFSAKFTKGACKWVSVRASPS